MCMFYLESRPDGGIIVARDRRRKTIGETIKKDLEVNDFTMDMFYDRQLWHRVIHVADST